MNYKPKPQIRPKTRHIKRPINTYPSPQRIDKYMKQPTKVCVVYELRADKRNLFAIYATEELWLKTLKLTYGDAIKIHNQHAICERDCEAWDWGVYEVFTTAEKYECQILKPNYRLCL